MVSAASVVDLVTRGVVSESDLIRGLVARAIDSAPCVLCMTDVEVFGGSTHQLEEPAQSVLRRVKAELMVHMESLRRHQHIVIFVGVTSRPWLLDGPLRRRFGARLHCPTPTPEERVAVLLAALEGVQHALDRRDLSRISEMTSLFSRADMVSLGDEAQAHVSARVQAARYFKPCVSSAASSGGDQDSDGVGYDTDRGQEEKDEEEQEGEEDGEGRNVHEQEEQEEKDKEEGGIEEGTEIGLNAAASDTLPHAAIKYTPCDATDHGAVAMTWRDVDGDKLQEPDLTYCDVVTALRHMEGGLNDDDIRRLNSWHEDFCTF